MKRCWCSKSSPRTRTYSLMNLAHTASLLAFSSRHRRPLCDMLANAPRTSTTPTIHASEGDAMGGCFSRCQHAKLKRAADATGIDLYSEEGFRGCHPAFVDFIQACQKREIVQGREACKGVGITTTARKTWLSTGSTRRVSVEIVSTATAPAAPATPVAPTAPVAPATPVAPAAPVAPATPAPERNSLPPLLLDML